MQTRRRFLPSLTRTEMIYIFICFSIYAVWALVFVSARYGADEMGRFDIPAFITLHNALPYGWEEEIRSPLWGFSYGFSTALPYWTSAVFIKLATHVSGHWAKIIFAARLTSILSMTGVAYYAILISKKLKLGQARWLFIVPMTLCPQIIYIASFYNLEAFALFTAMMIIYAWCCCLESGWSRKSCIRLAIGIALCFLSREFAYSFILGSFLLYCIWHLINRRQVQWGSFFKNGFLILGIVFVLCGWVFIRNAILYDGDIFALNMRTVYGELYAIPELKPSLRPTFAKQGLSMLGMLKASEWISYTAKSTVNMMGYMDILAHGWVYRGYLCLVTLGGVGLVLRAVRKKLSTTDIYILSSLLFCGIVTLMISLYYSWTVDYEPQGRYIITAMTFVWFAMLKGYQEIFDILAAASKLNKQKIVLCGTFLITAFIILTSAEGFIRCLEVLVWPYIWNNGTANSNQLDELLRQYNQIP